MVDWFKGLGVSVKVAALAFLAALAAMAAMRHKKTAEAWQGKAVEIEQGNVVKGIKTAEAASSQAKLSEARAEEVKKKAEARITQIGEKNEEISDILDRWRA